MSGRRVEAFLLRLVVHDDMTEHSETWRGQIQHVSSGSARHVESMHDIVAFIRELFGADYPVLLFSEEPSTAE